MTRTRNQTARRRLKSRRASRKGAAMIEFAIIANLMFVVVLTSMEFARMNMVRNLAQDAAYFAARHAIVPGATKDEAIFEAERILNSMVTSGYAVNVSDIDPDSAELTVDIAIDLDAVALFAPMFLPNSTIQTTARMQTERYDGFYEQ